MVLGIIPQSPIPSTQSGRAHSSPTRIASVGESWARPDDTEQPTNQFLILDFGAMDSDEKPDTEFTHGNNIKFSNHQINNPKYNILNQQARELIPGVNPWLQPTQPPRRNWGEL